METLLLIFETWWWVAPVAAGAGTAAYAGLRAPRRRARRLELDAARHEESTAVRALLTARADARAAQADVLAVRATSGEQPTGPVMLSSMLLGTPLVGSPATSEAMRQFQNAKLAEKSAALTLKASRARVKAMLSQYRAASASDPLPIEKVFAAHDAVIARWMSYETDPTLALTYPQLSDANRPATLAFLRAQRAAQEARPASARERIPPQQFVAYRDAVRTLATAFDDAERQAGAVPPKPSASRPGVWSVPLWRTTRQSSAD